MEGTAQKDIGKLEGRVDSVCTAVERVDSKMDAMATQLGLLVVQLSNHLIYHQTS